MLKLIPDTQHYFVSTISGGIYSNAVQARKNKYRTARLPNVKKRPIKLKGYLNRDGVLITSVYERTQRIADLVCLTVHGPRPGPNFTCKHLDGNQTNIKPGNLQWIDRRFDFEQLQRLGYSADLVKHALGFPGYWCTVDGQIISTMYLKPKVLKVTSHGHYGYHRVCLYTGGGSAKNVYLHKAIWEAFNGPIPKGLQVRHLNGDPASNYLDNLALGSTYDQTLDKVRHLKTKLDPYKAKEIREMVSGGLSGSAVADQFGISRRHVRSVVSNAVWKSPF